MPFTRHSLQTSLPREPKSHTDTRPPPGLRLLVPSPSTSITAQSIITVLAGRMPAPAAARPRRLVRRLEVASAREWGKSGGPRTYRYRSMGGGERWCSRFGAPGRTGGVCQGGRALREWARVSGEHRRLHGSVKGTYRPGALVGRGTRRRCAAFAGTAGAGSRAGRSVRRVSRDCSRALATPSLLSAKVLGQKNSPTRRRCGGMWPRPACPGCGRSGSAGRCCRDPGRAARPRSSFEECQPCCPKQDAEGRAHSPMMQPQDQTSMLVE